MAGTLRGIVEWGGTDDEEGYRENWIVWRIESDTSDGPSTIRLTPGLPLPGSPWLISFPNVSDADPFIWCRPEKEIVRHGQIKKGHLGKFWDVKQVFSNKPRGVNQQRCMDLQIEDPLLEPPIISGSRDRVTKEGTHDRFGTRILTSSHEPIRGGQNEWDDFKGVIEIKQNVATITQADTLPNLMVNHVNDRPLWGYETRCVRLTDAKWVKKLYGLCFVYYERTLTFSIDDKTHDRNFADEGYNVLWGHADATTNEWILDNIDGRPPDPLNPLHFKPYKTKEADMMKVLLDGGGRPFNPGLFRVSGCDQCPGGPGQAGTTQKWKVTGFGDDDEEDVRKYNGVILTQTTGCEWKPSALDYDDPDILDMRLYYEPNQVFAPGTDWILEIPALGDVQWTLEIYGSRLVEENEFIDRPEWKCLGPANYLGGWNLFTGLAISPETIKLTPGTGANPGNIKVEYYNEANFLLLGVPVTLG